MFGANVRDIGVNPYRNTYTSFVQNKNSGKVSEKFSEKIVETVCNGSSEKSDTVKFPGDVTMMLSRLVDTFFLRTSWTMLLYVENHSISVA